jgi:DNA repair protein RecO (recombination protein O)
MEVKTEAIVLGAVDYKDNDKLLTLFSPTLGKITAVARGVKKPTAKLAFCTQPFCFAEYVLAEKSGRYTVTSAYLHESFFSLREDVTRYFAGCVGAEACKTLSMENERYEGLFIALAELLKSLCLVGEDETEALVTFLQVALREIGYPLDLGYLEECDGDIGSVLWFDFADGRFAPFERCIAGERASVSTYHTLRKCAGLDYEEDKTAGGAKRALRLLKAFLYEKTEVKLDSLGEFIRMLD